MTNACLRNHTQNKYILKVLQNTETCYNKRVAAIKNKIILGNFEKNTFHLPSLSLSLALCWHSTAQSWTMNSADPTSLSFWVRSCGLNKLSVWNRKQSSNFSGLNLQKENKSLMGSRCLNESWTAFLWLLKTTWGCVIDRVRRVHSYWFCNYYVVFWKSI